jgi:beta-phosphoglucomutase-like phosphatase (HAD superfamily)
MRDKVILVDCDGVLLDWGYAFQQWMKRHGYIMKNPDVYDVGFMYGLERNEKRRLCRMFNESATIRKVPPLRDSIKYVKKLHEEHGYIFHAITSLSNDEYAQHLRTKNLQELFGPTVFEKYVYLDTGADKDEVLEAYRGTGCVWVEDKPENATAGAKVGLESLVMEHGYNKDCDFPLMRNWKDIYEYILGN